MQRTMIIFGAALLAMAGLLTYFAGRRRALPARWRRRYARIRICARTLRLLQRAARAALGTQASAAFEAYAGGLMQGLMQLRRKSRHVSALPAGEDGQPRLMRLAKEVADKGDCTAEALTGALRTWNEGHAASSELAAFPLCVTAAAADRLSTALDVFLQAVGKKAAGDDAEVTAEVQTMLAEEMRRAGECFGVLSRLNWLVHAEQADEMHRLLLEEPSGVYGRMTAESRLMLRRQAEDFSRYAGIGVETVVNQAIQLSQDAPDRSLEAYAGFWFQDAKGIVALHRSLKARKGRIYVRLAAREEKLRYTALCCLGIVGGFVFLQAGNPVFVLPFFAVTAGSFFRRMVSRRGTPSLPGMTIDSLSDELRTLVVMPAVLRDPHEAIVLVRRLKTVRQAFPQEGVDFLLLGDFADSMTAVSSGDAAVVHAAYSALSALGAGESCMYLHRGRTWNGDRHAYCARDGQSGAVREVCRLIAQGECEDIIAFSSVEAARLERRYAYLLVLPPDSEPSPGALEALLSAMTHPMNARYPTVDGYRGYAVLTPEGRDVFQGCALLRPDAFLEATDGMIPPHWEADMLCGELAGHASVPGARIRSEEEEGWGADFKRTFRAWQLSAWQLPWVSTPSGLVRNPLRFLERFHLRERLRSTLVPAAQCGLLLWAVLTQSWALLLLALLAPELLRFPRRVQDWIGLGCRLSLLPMRSAIGLRAIAAQFLSSARKEAPWPSLEVWVQGIAATIMTALGVVIPHMAVPALALGAMFACFPLAHRAMHAPLRQEDGLTRADVALLEDASAATWRFFQSLQVDTAAPLPPCSVQFEPALGAVNATSPAAIGAYMLAWVCAKELGLTSAAQAAKALHETAAAFRGLPMPFGLPCRRYALPSGTILDAHSDAADAGFLLSALLTSAQALRSWMAELPPEYEGMSAEVQAAADAVDPAKLYDAEAGLFRAGLDEDGQGSGYVSCFSDAALLLSIAARARRAIPPEHFDRLDRTCVQAGRLRVPLSRAGTAADNLLPGLFVPGSAASAGDFIRMMQQRGRNGVFGQGECGYFGFDAALNYRKGTFGIQEAALERADVHPVYAPYAAALCLPHEPHQASAALQAFHQLGAFGPLGFCDAVDMTQGAALIGLHDTFHQGLILMAAAHVLADAPVQRYFCALPEVEACLPHLTAPSAVLTVPALPVFAASHKPEAAAERIVDPMDEPVDSLRLGTDGFFMTTDARGCSRLEDDGILLTQTDASALHGVQFYLADEGRVYRLGDPLVPGQAAFTAGEARFERLCGSLKAELVCTVDTVRRRALHILTVTNLSTRDRVISLADCLLPELGASAGTLEAEAPEKGRLRLHARGTSHTLYHTMDSAAPLLASAVCTDADAFLGRNGTLHKPAALDAPMVDVTSASARPGLAFRAKLMLGGRGQAKIWFTTSLAASEPPRLTELEGLRRLAALQHAALAEEHQPSPPSSPAQKLVLPLLSAGSPRPAMTPEFELSHQGRYGGFEPETEDYVMVLAPGMNAPEPWTNVHISQTWREETDDLGFRSPLREEVWLLTEDGTLLSPWSAELPRSVRMGAGSTIWEAWSDDLDLKLCASCLPGHRCGLRVLRVRNASDRPIAIRVLLRARLADAPCELLPGFVITQEEDSRLQRYIGGEGWTARRIIGVGTISDRLCTDLPDDENGGTALMEYQLSLAPGASGEAVWLSGQARHDEDIARAALSLADGASTLLRSVRSDWARCLGRITCTTPEDTFDLLMNRILPVQALSAPEAARVSAAAILSPTAARRSLLRAAKHAQTREEWVRLALRTADYIQNTGDRMLLDAYFVHRDATLLECFQQELLSLPMDRNGLPQGDNPALRCMQHALAAQRLDQLRPTEALREFSRKLLSAADAHLWQDGSYGKPLRLDVQCLACMAYGATPRTRQAIMAAWDALYDQAHGLIRRHEPMDIPPLPGLPENGGMHTEDAVLCIRALLMTGHAEQAFELLRAINPLHHTDTPERQEVFRGAPYLLHGGMCASPMEAGRAIPEGGAEAASMLYALILHGILGFHRAGNVIRMTPNVPPEWEEYTITLQEGSATWYISMERRILSAAMDGHEMDGAEFTIHDDGRIHQVRIPLK